MRSLLWLGCLVFFCTPLPAQVARSAAPLPLDLLSPVQDKNFYLLSLFERTPDALRAFADNPALQLLAQAKRKALKRSAEECTPAPACHIRALLWSDEETAAVTAALRALYTDHTALRSMVDGPIRRSGVFQRYQSHAGSDLLVEAWGETARGLNNIIEIYGNGRPPRYPQIDSPSFDAQSDTYRRLLQVVAGVLDDQTEPTPLFFQPTLRFALALLNANHRDEAGRFEPLDTGENAAALRHAKTLRWDEFPYSVIVVPGAGTDRLTWNLSPWAKARLTLAASRFRQGKAPYILVSGGYVHPNQTPFAEAIEMKRSLVADFGLPADVILVDPHARHTTTNLRNAARQIYRYGLPFGKTALITTDQFQSRYIESSVFQERCTKELHYQPHQLGKRISPYDLEFVPRMDSLHADSLDPLDP